MTAKVKTIPDGPELNMLFADKVKLYQQKEGYRFSVDAVLLAAFALARTSGRVVDLGTGNGIVPVILAGHEKFSSITGVEIQEGPAALAEKNICYNDCQDRVEILHADLRNIRTVLPAETFDTATMNPPFYAAGSGRVSPDRQNAAARHELYGNLADFITSASYLLKQKGRLVVVYNPSRLVDLITLMRASNIEPKNLQFVHGKVNSPAAMVLAEGIKAARAEVKILPPLIMYGLDGKYTRQAQAVFDSI